VTDDERTARRAYIREHHPDRGGDPDAFIAGLRRWHGGRRTPSGEPDKSGEIDEIVVIRRSRGRWLRTWWRRRRSSRRNQR
jgi:hypothetical protein